MQIQFQKKPITCLRQCFNEIRNSEHTAEIRLPEGYPDIGRILAAWGQALLRGKEWNGSGITLTGGVMAWVMYLPEDGSEPRVLDTWVPFQTRWELTDGANEPVIRASVQVRSADARTLSARKMMVRIGICAACEALDELRTEVYEAPQVDDGIELLKDTRPVELILETGEKTFLLDEELTLPPACRDLVRLLHYEVMPEVREQRIMGSRVVFRGALRLHLLCRTGDEKLASCDLEAPFSQYEELSGEYESGAAADVCVGVTSLELEPAEEGKLLMKCGLVGQYAVSDRVLLEQVTDGYCPHRAVELELTQAELPAILDRRVQAVTQTLELPTVEGTPVDVCFYSEGPRSIHMPDQVRFEIPGGFQALYYDGEGKLQSAFSRCEQTVLLPADEQCGVTARFQTVGAAQIQGRQASAEGVLSVRFTGMDRQTAASGITVGDPVEPDPNRPSLVLRRADENTGLWDLAKGCGSTVALIRQANGLQQEPESGQLLLIPVI